jgi:hypothetical protein
MSEQEQDVETLIFETNKLAKEGAAQTKWLGSLLAELDLQFNAEHFDFNKLGAIVAEAPDSMQAPDDMVSHHFCGGVYLRKMTAPAGALIVGRKHAVGMFNIVLSGRIRVYSQGGITDVCAPAIIPGVEGDQKLGYVLEDVVWANVTPSDTEDIDAIEQRIYCL